MARNLNPKCKQCRRAGEKLFLKGERCFTAKCAIVNRNYPPGFHGPKGKRRRQSDYGLQLNEKQKAKRQYQILEKQFRLTFARAEKKVGNTGDNLIKFLETRLDNTVYRLGFATSRNQARQLVNHGQVMVDSKKVTIPSYQVKSGNVIKLKDGRRKSKSFKELMEKLKRAETPAWLNLTAEDLSGKVLHLPRVEDINTNINAQMIVEYYSR